MKHCCKFSKKYTIARENSNISNSNVAQKLSAVKLQLMSKRSEVRKLIKKRDRAPVQVFVYVL